MSKLIAVRVPDDLAALMPEKGKSEFVISALRCYVGRPQGGKPLPPDTVGVSLGVGTYQRPAHDPTCKCYLCALKIKR